MVEEQQPAAADALKLRRATHDDALRLFHWRNDALTRANSHHMAELDWATHQSWLTATLASPQRRLWIAEEQHVAVGCVREDEMDGAIELSWTVAPEARGRGVAQRMIAWVVARRSQPLRAEVKVANAASRRIAEAAGLRLMAERDGVCYYERR